MSTCVADVSTEEGRGVLVQQAGTLFGDRLHCLVNSAGYYSATDYEKQFQTNLDSAFFLCKSFHPLLKLTAAVVGSTSSSSSSSIVNIGSVSGTMLSYHVRMLLIVCCDDMLLLLIVCQYILNPSSQVDVESV